MVTRNGISKVVGGVVIAGALTLTSVFSSAVSADGGIHIGVGELQECTISKNMDGAGDGADFLTWQRNLGPSASTGSDDLADWQANYGTNAQVADPEYKYLPIRR